MNVSKNVTLFATIGLTAVAVNTFVGVQQSQTQTQCADLSSAIAALSYVAQANASNSLSGADIKLETVKVNTKIQADYNQCIAQSEHAVSWKDWVFSWQDSPTFHYLDLLELLSSDNKSHNSGDNPTPVKSR